MARYAPIEADAGIGIDTDTRDYYDDGALPPPHRLSTLYSPSPYHEALPAASRSSLHQEIGSGSSNRYSDPFHRSSSSRPLSMDSNHNGSYGHAAPLAGAGYGGARYDDSYAPYGKQFESADDLNENGAWSGAPQTQAMLSNNSHPYANAGAAVSWPAHTPALDARERYMARMEANGGNGYDEKQGLVPQARGSRKKWWWIAGGVVAVILIIAGVAAGVALHSKKSKGPATAGVVQTSSNDPSSFTKDPRLKQSFYAMCYTPFSAQYPACGAVQSNVTEDIQLLSQLTTRLRLYGADCGVSEMVLTAIEQTKVNMTVWLALWVDDDDATWQRQLSETQSVLKKHGVDHVEGLIVGNEYILNGGSVATLLQKVTQVKTWVTSQNYAKTLPVATADAGSMITTELAEGVDVVMANVHAWFAGTLVTDAAGWTWDYTNNNDPGTAVAAATNKPDLWIAETGWPTNANDTAAMTLEGAQAGVPELQDFLNTFVCQANANITADATAAGTSATAPSAAGVTGPYNKYAFFEAFDETWKSIYGGVEPYWGLFDANKQLKNVTIPDCSVQSSS